MFENLKVLELASVLAGPSVGQFFAELGAEVIKVENPHTAGDVTRSWKLPSESSQVSAYFASVNFNKKSIAIDLQSKEGLAVVHRLIEKVDIVITSFKMGDDVKLKLDYATIQKINPRILHGKITAYGNHDPRPGFDAIIQAESGFMYMNGEKGGKPSKMPVALVDVLAGHQLKEGILLSYIKLLKTGKGDSVSVSLFDAALSSLVNQASNWINAGQIPEKMGSQHPNIAPYGEVLESSDGQQIFLAVGNDRQFLSLCTVLQCSELSKEEAYKNNAGRVAHRSDLMQVLQRKAKQMTGAELLEGLLSKEVPAGKILNMKEVFELEPSKEMLVESLLNGQKIKAVQGVAAKFASISNSSPHFTPPPLLGQHTVEVLHGLLSIKDNEINDLRERNVIL